MKMIVMLVALMAAALTVAAMVGCAGRTAPHNDLHNPGPLKNTGQTI